MSNRSITIAIKPGFTGRGGTVGFISWVRLVEILQQSGELRKGETIEGYRVEEAGINFFFDKE